MRSVIITAVATAVALSGGEAGTTTDKVSISSIIESTINDDKITISPGETMFEEGSGCGDEEKGFKMQLNGKDVTCGDLVSYCGKTDMIGALISKHCACTCGTAPGKTTTEAPFPKGSGCRDENNNIKIQLNGKDQTCGELESYCGKTDFIGAFISKSCPCTCGTAPKPLPDAIKKKEEKEKKKASATLPAGSVCQTCKASSECTDAGAFCCPRDHVCSCRGTQCYSPYGSGVYKKGTCGSSSSMLDEKPSQVMPTLAGFAIGASIAGLALAFRRRSSTLEEPLIA